MMLLSFLGFDNLGGHTELLLSRCLLQDEEGMIWFGTDKHLYSYDGYDLRSYPGPDGQKLINALVVQDENIYMGCNDGLHIYDKQYGTYSTSDYFEEVIRCMVSYDDVIYLGTQTGLYSYDCSSLAHSLPISRISSDEVLSLSIYDDMIWVGTVKGLAGFDAVNVKYYDPDQYRFMGHDINVVSAICQENDSTLWIGTPGSLFNVDMNKRTCSVVAHLPVLKSLISGPDGLLYIGTDDGLYTYEKNSELLIKVKETTVWASQADKGDNLWFATDNGLIVRRYDSVFSFLDTGDVPENALYSSVLKDSGGRVWVGSTYGLLLYVDDGNGSYDFVRHYSMGDGLHQVPHNKVKSIVEDRSDGNIYIATDGGVLRYDPVTEGFSRVNSHGVSNWFYDMVFDGNKLLLASYDGVFSMTEGRFMELCTVDNGLSTNDVAQIAKDKADRVWIRTRDQRVFILDEKTGKVTRFPVENHVEGRFCDSLMSDMDGNIWISVNGKVIRMVEDRVERSFAFNAREAMEIFSMCDFNGMICICSSEGIFMLDKENGEVRHLNTGIRYLILEYDEASGNVLMGGLGCLSYCPVDEFAALFKTEDRKIYLTSAIVNGLHDIPLSDLRDGSLSLEHDQNNLTLTVTDYNYNSEIPCRFSVRLRHKNDDWTEIISGNTIFLPELNPGKYELYVFCDEELSDSTGKILSITIMKPWYASTLMLVIYSLILCLLIAFIVRFFTLRKYLDLEREKRVVILEQSKQKEEFLGNIAHEFKTPLSLIIAPLGKLLNDIPGNDNKTVLKIAYENATRLNALVHNAIDYYKKPVTDDELIKCEVEFVGFAKAIFQSYKQYYPEHEFIFNSLDSSVMVDVDVVKMTMVLTNLMSNACKYTPEGGSVIMTLERNPIENLLYLKLSDTGIGIPEDELNLVFQRYFESSRSKGRQYDSTGIGLSIIRKYVKRHDGAVYVDSDDNGTTFTVVIPCRPVDGNSSAAVSSSEDDAGKPLIVVVDDNPQICSLLEMMLNDKYRCVCANNGKSGLKLCMDVVPDLIITDVVMPVMDGMEMCRHIKASKVLSMIPIILLTVNGDKYTERRSIELNIDSFVPKPFEYATLLAKIDQLIGNKKRMEQKLRLQMLCAPSEIQEMSQDERFLRNVTQIIEEHIDDDALSVRKLCELGGFNEKQVYRKIKMLTGMSTIEYIRSVRLKKAAILLQKGTFTVSEVMYSVGFGNASYFTRAFSSEYGKTPSEYIRSYRDSGYAVPICVKDE